MGKRVTTEQAIEAVLLLFLKSGGEEKYYSRYDGVTTHELAQYLEISEQTVRKLLRKRETRRWGPDTETYMGGPVDGIVHKAAESAGRGRGFYPERWLPTKEVVYERLAAMFALAGHTAENYRASLQSGR